MTIKGLKVGEEDAFCAHCALCFSERARPPPAAYFARHLANDPAASLQGVRCAIDEGEGGAGIVATVRVFVRQVKCGRSTSLPLGGIGEVCTRKEFRRRGLSRALMRDALRWMREEAGMGAGLSSLHGGGAVQPFYASLGYVSTPVHYAKVEATPPVAGEDDTAAVVTAELSGESCRHLEAVSTMYDAFCAQLDLVGPMVRSAEYWQRWVANEIPQADRFVQVGEGGNVEAYAAFRVKTHASGEATAATLYLADFAACEVAVNRDGGFHALQQMFYQFNSQRVDRGEQAFEVMLCPYAVAHRFPGVREPDVDAADEGWMYRSVAPVECEAGDAGETGAAGEPWASLVTAFENPKRHVVWRVDDF